MHHQKDPCSKNPLRYADNRAQTELDKIPGALRACGGIVNLPGTIPTFVFVQSGVEEAGEALGYMCGPDLLYRGIAGHLENTWRDSHQTLLEAQCPPDS